MSFRNASRELERAIENCVEVDINVDASMVDEILLEHGIVKVNLCKVSIVNGFIEYDGYRIAQILPTADNFALTEFKREIGDNSALSHIPGAATQNLFAGGH